MRRTISALALFGISTVVPAQDPVFVPTAVPYADDSVGSPNLRKECDWNAKMSAYIVDYSDGAAVLADDKDAASHARFLSLAITSVHAAGGGGFSGPKWAMVHGELHQSGQVIGSFAAMRDTGSGGGFTACGSMQKIGRAIGHDISEWLKTPTMDAKLGSAR